MPGSLDKTNPQANLWIKHFENCIKMEDLCDYVTGIPKAKPKEC